MTALYNTFRTHRVLGIDSGAKRCGISFIDIRSDGSLELKSADAIGAEPTAKETYGQHRRRLVSMWTDDLGVLLDAWEPNLVICETVPITGAANASGQRLKALMVVVVAQVLCVQREIAFQEVGANTVKKRVTGIGDATKPKVREAIISVFPDLAERRKEMIKTPDISDAIAVALVGAGYEV